MSAKKPTRPSSSSGNNARSMAAEYNKNIRMTMGGTGKNAKVYSVADNWASHYKPREETKVFANAVGFPKRTSAIPFRIPGREDQSLASAEDPATKFSGADVKLVGQPSLKKKLLKGIPRNPIRRDGSPYWHFSEPISIAETTAGSPVPKSAACYFNDSVARSPTTVPNFAIALLPTGEEFAAENDEHDLELFSELDRQKKEKEEAKSNYITTSTSPKKKRHSSYSSSSSFSPSPGSRQRQQRRPPSSLSSSSTQVATNNNNNNNNTILTRPSSALAALELLEDTTEGTKHKTRDVFKESYTKLPPCSWRIESVSKKDREKVKLDAVNRVIRWYRGCKRVSKERQVRREQRTAREERNRQLVILRSAVGKAQRAVHRYVIKFTGLRRRVAAMEVCRVMRLGCKTRINESKSFCDVLREEKRKQLEQDQIDGKRHFAATEIQRMWRGVRRRYVTKVMLYVFSLAKEKFEKDFFDATYHCWLYHFTFIRVRRAAATTIQRSWKRFIVRRDYNVARFLNAVDLPCPRVCIARRVQEDVDKGRAATFEEAIFASPPRHSVASRVMLERGDSCYVSSNNKNEQQQHQSIKELSRRLGEAPPVPKTYAKEFYSRRDKHFEHPTFNL